MDWLDIGGWTTSWGSCSEEDFLWLGVEFLFICGEEGGDVLGFTGGDFLRDQWE
jgi:hypothetical protein